MSFLFPALLSAISNPSLLKNAADIGLQLGKKLVSFLPDTNDRPKYSNSFDSLNHKNEQGKRDSNAMISRLSAGRSLTNVNTPVTARRHLSMIGNQHPTEKEEIKKIKRDNKYSKQMF